MLISYFFPLELIDRGIDQTPVQTKVPEKDQLLEEWNKTMAEFYQQFPEEFRPKFLEE